jgi:GNAT superfamily N-acetyltransferase
MTVAHGPLGFTDLDAEGMLVEGFAERATMATLHNPPYYPAHLERMGYSKQVDWVEYRIAVPSEMPDRLARLCRRVEERLGLRTLHFRSRRELKPWTRPVFALLNEAYAGLHGFVPLTDAQVDDVIRRFFGFLRPEFVFVVLDADDRLAAFGITLPSLAGALQRAKGRLFPLGWFHLLRALRTEKALDLLLVGVRPDLQGHGVNALLIRECIQVCLSHGILYAESNPGLETNSRVQSQWKAFDARQHKRRRCYFKNLVPVPSPASTLVRSLQGP